MSTRTYGQYCGVARALELVGERWGLLIVRDLLMSPKRYTQLRRGLPRIPSNVLSTRLKELEEAGVVRRRVLPRPASAVVYELTEYGSELEDIVVRLGYWGAKSMGEPRPDDSVSAESLILLLRNTVQADAARGLRASYELRVLEAVVQVHIDDGIVELGEGPADDPDLVIETDLNLRRLLLGELEPEAAVESGVLELDGRRELLRSFFEVFNPPAALAAPAAGPSTRTG
jgi:DNA-binding HxlR family transcriptional regulator